MCMYAYSNLTKWPLKMLANHPPHYVVLQFICNQITLRKLDVSKGCHQLVVEPNQQNSIHKRELIPLKFTYD